jgi:hypothetical protein
MAVKTIMSLLNIADSYNVSGDSAFFTEELNWMVAETGAPPAEALFITYPYTGPNYGAFFQSVETIFANFDPLHYPNGIKLVGIDSGNPESLIKSARMFVIPGGEIKTFITLLNQLITPTFNPWLVIKSMVLSGTPFLAWNEGASLVSPKPFSLPSTDLTTTLGISPYQIITNYTASAANKTLIKTLLQNNPSVQIASGMASTLVAERSKSRLEDKGAGILQTRMPGIPTITNYFLAGGILKEN